MVNQGRANVSFALVFFFLLSSPAVAAQLAPFKDLLFSYPAILESQDGGAYRIVDYREMRDIKGRDAVPERRVRGHYVSTDIRQLQHDLVAHTQAGPIRHFVVGRLKQKPRFITVYLHGQGGNRHQGVNDLSFGGNFNRIKNLMGRNGGLYISPDFSDFGERGAAEIAALLSAYAQAAPDASIFLACGSMGGALCWRIANQPEIVPHLGGLLLLGSFWSEDFLTSEALRRRVPVFFGHGSGDDVFPIEKQEAFYRSIRQVAPDYPALFVRFETGSHGTPIRMMDWRETLNWMLAVRR